MCLIILISIFLALSKQKELFVEQHGCSTNCNGTKSYPFDNILEAFDYVAKDAEQNEIISINLKDERIYLKEFFLKNKAQPGDYLNLFRDNKKVMMEIISKSSSNRTEIFFDGPSIFSFKINGGILKFINIHFSMAEEKQLDSIKTSYVKSALKGEAFIDLQAKSEVLLEIKNCSFIGIFFDFYQDKKSHNFHSLINFKNNAILTRSFLLLENVSFTEVAYPKAIILVNNLFDSNSSKNKPLLELKNISVINCFTKDFPKWNFLNQTQNNDDPAYYDFLLYLNFTETNLVNISIKNSARFLLADSFNTINILNLSVVDDPAHSEQFLKAPEMIYLLFNNSLIAKNLAFDKLDLITYDENTSDEEKNISYLKDNEPTTLMDFDRNQAFLKLGSNNEAFLSNISLRDSEFLRKETFFFGFILAEMNNNLTMVDLFIENMTMTTESRLGLLGFLVTLKSNNVYLRSALISNFKTYFYTFSCFLFTLSKNSIEL